MFNFRGIQQIPKISKQFIRSQQMSKILQYCITGIIYELCIFKFTGFLFIYISQLCLFSVAHFYDSIALTVDNPELFNRIAEAFSSKVALRFVILLWGDKSCLDSKVFGEVPVYNYQEILQLGHESRMILLNSHDARKLLCIQHQTLYRRSCSTVEYLIYI